MPNTFTHRSVTRPQIIALAVGCLIVLAIIGSALGRTENNDAKPAQLVDLSTPAASAADDPVVTQQEVVELVVLNYGRQTVEDAASAAGTTAITTVGVNGELKRTYLVALKGGKETSRELVSEVVSRPAIDEVTTVGTFVAPVPIAAIPSECDPNYQGVCVPIASDVDCAGGSGNGPAYVSGPVYVVGSDIYDLDRDGDGVACDS